MCKSLLLQFNSLLKWGIYLPNAPQPPPVLALSAAKRAATFLTHAPSCISKLIKDKEILWNQSTEHQKKRGYCGCSCYCDMLSLTVFVMFIFPPTLLPWAHSHFFFLLLSSLLFSLPPSFLFLLSQLEVLHYRLSISSKHHGSPAQSSYQALHAYQVLPSFHFVSF